MPRGDGSGPVGFGPMTGRSAGYCAGYGVPGYANPGFGRRGLGWGRGFGYGRGLGYGWGYGRGYGLGYGSGVLPQYPVNDPALQDSVSAKEDLKMEADYLKGQMEAISGRLSEIDEAIKKLGRGGSRRDDSE